ncbi:alpha/beta hydrolase [Streptomyces sp. NPDC060209]|uniref:alpha/beta hydrolase n=1 Tax=Streptomyces sp. NPDC060209 TaxID=3347073 RepID=UPI00364B3785
MEDSMALFGLVHGACHRAAHWEILSAELQGRGHSVMTVDLPVNDLGATQDDYLESAVEAFKDATEPVIVVGHSLAGYTTLRLEQRIPVSGLVFLCATIMFPPGLYPDEPAGPISIPPEDMPVDAQGLINLTFDAARTAFYLDCEPEVTKTAVEALVPQTAAAVAGPMNRVERPTAQSIYIQASEDRSVYETWSTWFAEMLTGRPALRIKGSHSPFLSRPAELADMLETFAATLAGAPTTAVAELKMS